MPPAEPAATRVRPVASPDELTSVWGFLARQLGLTERHPRPAAHYVAQVPALADFLLVAEEDGTVIGALFASPLGTGLLLGEMAVAPDRRGQGVGGALLAELERRARGYGKTSVLVGAWESAAPFYVGHGYTPWLFLQIEGPDSAARLRQVRETLLASYPLIGAEEGATLSKLTVELPALDDDLKHTVERIIPGCHASYLCRKAL